MKREDVEFSSAMLQEILGENTDWMLISSGKESCASCFSGDPTEIAKSIMTAIHRGDKTAEMVLEVILKVGYNLMLNSEEPSRKFTEMIFKALELPE